MQVNAAGIRQYAKYLRSGGLLLAAKTWREIGMVTLVIPRREVGAQGNRLADLASRFARECGLVCRPEREQGVLVARLTRQR